MTAGPATARPTVDVVVPVFNEARTLRTNIVRLHAHLGAALDEPWQITIAENGSTDDTLGIARAVGNELDHVRVLHLDEAGRGRALREAWLSSAAEIVAYMDADLSTDLAAIGPLLAPIRDGHADLTLGSRLAAGAVVTRTRRRELVSQAYNHLVRVVLHAPVRDAQCGFKALRAQLAPDLLVRVEDQGWFFDTELLIAAQRAGLRIVEIPVTWVEDRDSTVKLLRTAWADLCGIARVARRRQLV